MGPWVVWVSAPRWKHPGNPSGFEEFTQIVSGEPGEPLSSKSIFSPPSVVLCCAVLSWLVLSS